MWDERCRFKLFCAWGGIQWRKCYFNHLTETVLVGFCRFNEFLQRECSQHFLNPDFPSRRLSLWGLSEGKRGAVLALLWVGSFANPLFYRLHLLPRIAQNISFWALNGFASQQSKMFWKLFTFLRLCSLSLPSNACCITAVDIACSKWVSSGGRIRLSSSLFAITASSCIPVITGLNISNLM